MMSLPRSKRPAAAQKRIYVAVRIGNPILYEITSGGVTEVSMEELPEEATVVTCDEFDTRIETARTVSHSAATRLAMRTTGERLWVVNRSKDLRAIYGRAPERIKEFGRRTAPGAMVFDILAAKRGLDRRNVIVGLDAGESPRLVVVYGYRGDGEQSPPQFAIEPHDVRLFIDEYARMNEIAPERAPELFSASEFLEAVSRATRYPAEPTLAGIEQSRVYWTIAAVTATAAISIMAYAGWQWRTGRIAEESAAAARAESARLASEVSAMTESNPKGLARAAGLDAERILRLASSVWSPGMSVSVDASAESIVLRVRARELGGSGTAANTTAPSSRTEFGQIRNALERETPADTTRGSLSVERGLNEFIVEYRAESGLGPLGAGAHQ